jgi:threonine synthase
VLKFKEHLPAGRVVCTLTGHGLKDPDVATATFPDLRPIPPRLDAVTDFVGL